MRRFFIYVKGLRVKETIKQHIMNNKKEYIIVTLLFIIWIFLGVFFVNNLDEIQKNEVQEYLNNFVEKMKQTENLDNISLLKTSIVQNVVLAVIIWFFGTTVIGIPVVFGILIFRGFCFGYTISVCVTIMGMSKGLAFVLINLLLPSLLLIPATLALAVSGFKLYKSIVKDSGKENVKMEIIRHTVFSLIMLATMIGASLVDVFISTNILKLVIKYF